MDQGPCELDRFFKLVTNPSKLEGTLRVEPVPSVASVTFESLEGYLVGCDIHNSAIDREAIEQLREMIHGDPGSPHEHVVARGIAAVHGDSVTYTIVDELAKRIETVQSRIDAIKDGSISDEHIDELADTPQGEANAVSYYDQMSFVVVHKGDPIAIKSERSDGVDGMDIYGIAIPAHEGKANEGVLDDSISVAKDGTCTAAVSGVLTATQLKIAISKVLEIKGDVDFTTGRIVFPGKVAATGSVRDQFGVWATGDVEIGGLVEVATLESDSSIVLWRGMAGKETGTINAKGNLVAGYLEGVVGEIGRDVSVKGEITNSKLTIRGELYAENAAIRGGRIQIARHARAGAIGSVQGVVTDLVIGSVPEVEHLIRTTKEFLEQIQSTIQTKTTKMESISAVIAKPTPTQIEDQMGMQFEIDELNERMERLRSSRAQLGELLSQNTVARLTTMKSIYAKSVIYMPGHRIRFTKDLVGESLLEVDPSGHPVLKLLGQTTDLNQYAEVITDDSVLKILQGDNSPAAA